MAGILGRHSLREPGPEEEKPLRVECGSGSGRADEEALNEVLPESVCLFVVAPRRAIYRLPLHSSLHHFNSPAFYHFIPPPAQ